VAPAPAPEPLPAVEWWDRRLLQPGATAYPDLSAGTGAAALAAALRPGRVGRLVEHPVPIEPPAEAPPPPPPPLKLTKRELRKLRTQRRQAREKEKQELIRQGLLEPPKPKVRIANLMRVLGAEATADPTAVEAEVRRQMAERTAAHDDRNLARKLLPSEKREKKLKKLFDDGAADGGATHVAVYRVDRLTDGSQRFKVDVNAQENHMSGVALIPHGGPFALVVVEGCVKAHKRYAKLMLRRIDWAAPPAAEGDEAGEEEAEDEDAAPPNACHLVWQGLVAEPTFPGWRVHKSPSADAARALLAQRGVAHYWDTARDFDAASAPIIEL